MRFEKVAVQDRGDPTDYLPVFSREKQPDLGLFKERMLTGEELALLEEKGRNPVRVVLIDTPRQTEEGVKISIGGDREDLHAQITPSFLPTVWKAFSTWSM